MPKFSNDIFTAKSSGFYLFGGQDDNGKALNDLWILRLPKPKSKKRTLDPNFEWERINPVGVLPKPRYGHTCTLVSGYLIVVGGRNDEQFHSEGVIHLSEIVAFNIQACRWENIKLHGTPPEGRWGACAELVGSKLVLYGGMELSNYCNSDICFIETDQDVAEDLAIGDDMMLKFEKAMRKREVIRRNVQKLVQKPSVRNLFRKMF
mmetsp:Transcript_6251/g.10842  ORF Transcript_6251/g.10842 Transcript_6251/m.10842 type:complete len:206 (-) Transcript_6251:32-649(-)